MDVSATRRAPASPTWRRLPARPPGLAVLIVSGDPSVRAIAMRELENGGYVVTCAAHSGHALLACLTRGRIDLAFIEATLEDMPGAELACTLRRHLPELRVVFLAPAGTPAAPGVVVRPLTGEKLVAELAVLTLTAS
jgi:CheY-like chemotaxis protein